MATDLAKHKIHWPFYGTRTGVSPSTSLTPCNYNATNRPYSYFIYLPQALCNCNSWPRL